MRTRAERRRNAIAKDLRTPKYAPRVVKPKYEEPLRADWKKYVGDDDLGRTNVSTPNGLPPDEQED